MSKCKSVLGVLCVSIYSIIFLYHNSFFKSMKSMSVDICVSRVIFDDRNVGQPLA